MYCHTSLVFVAKMVICAVFNCENWRRRDKDKRFFRLPSVITHQGVKALGPSLWRQVWWLSKTRGKILRHEQYSHTRVYSDHFISDSPAALFDENNLHWAPSINLGHDSELRVDSAKAISGRYARAVERSRKGGIAEGEAEVDPEAPEADSDSDMKLLPTMRLMATLPAVILRLFIKVILSLHKQIWLWLTWMKIVQDNRMRLSVWKVS